MLFAHHAYRPWTFHCLPVPSNPGIDQKPLGIATPLLCLLQLNWRPCSLLFSLLKFKISVISLTRYLFSRALLAHPLLSCLWNKYVKQFEIDAFQIMWTRPNFCFSLWHFLLSLTSSMHSCAQVPFPHTFRQKNDTEPNYPKNYCPVSNLPFICKLLEKTVLQQLNNHLSNNNLIHPF